MLAVVLLGARPAFAAPSPPGPSASMLSSSTLNFYSQDMHKQQTLQVSFFDNSTTQTRCRRRRSLARTHRATRSPRTRAHRRPPARQRLLHQRDVGCAARRAGAQERDVDRDGRQGTNTGTDDVALSGTAITGTLSSDQYTLDFGGLVVDEGNSNQQHVTISDDLSASVDVSNVQITGACASSFDVQNNGRPADPAREHMPDLRPVPAQRGGSPDGSAADQQ